MQPNRARDGLSKGGRQKPQALPQGGKISAAAQPAPKEIYRNGGKSKRLKETVE
jgi:hypothetical protein